MFFDSWHGILRVLIVGVYAYAAVIAILRITGKRTLAKMNAFDLVVTVALGSTLSSILLSKDVALFEGVTALALLALLQFVIAWSSIRSRFAERLAKSNARILLRDGHIDSAALRDERVTHDELLAAVRSGGFGDTGLIAAVVLETDGSFSVISKAQAGSGSALPDAD